MAQIAQRILDQRNSSLRPPLGAVPAGAVSLALGEPDFPAPPAVQQAAIDAIAAGNTHYTDQHGIVELRRAVLKALPGPDQGWGVDNVVITHGATAGLGATFFALLNPGDRVVIPEPAYSLYADQVTLAGGIVDYVPLGEDLHFDFAALKQALPGARMLVFSNPSNPNGVVHTRKELSRLAELLEGSETLVVADEAYSSLVLSEDPFVSALEIEGLADRTLYVQTMSKKYCMTGWRVGYVAGGEDLIAAIAQFHRTFNGSVSEPAQLAALAAFGVPEHELAGMREEYLRRRDFVVAGLAEIPHIRAVTPTGAFYCFFSYDVPTPSAEIAADLAQRGVVVRAGAEYGPHAEGHIRLSFAASMEDLQRGLAIIRDYFTALP